LICTGDQPLCFYCLDGIWTADSASPGCTPLFTNMMNNSDKLKAYYVGFVDHNYTFIGVVNITSNTVINFTEIIINGSLNIYAEVVVSSSSSVNVDGTLISLKLVYIFIFGLWIFVAGNLEGDGTLVLSQDDNSNDEFLTITGCLNVSGYDSLTA